jgi:hypothetical protein
MHVQHRVVAFATGMAMWIVLCITIAQAAPPCPHCAGDVVCGDPVTHRCVVVPARKQLTKTVYEVREVPFCLPKLPSLLGHLRKCCSACPECDCPRYRKVLLKKQVVCEEVCVHACVVKEVVQQVPAKACGPGCLHCGDVLPPVVFKPSPAIPMPPLPSP